MATFRLPPRTLVKRVGWNLHSSDPADVYEERGREHWLLIKSLLPVGWDFTGKRVLDFGAGAGRIVRHGLADEPAAAFWACDIDGRSTSWMQKHLSPPLNVFQTAQWPPTSCAPGSFDLIYAFSVWTHLVDEWSAWLLEMHRLLDPEGVLIITVFGPGIAAHGMLPIGDNVTGMNVLAPGTPWDGGGPLIVHSEWWLRTHWGRAFEIVELRPGQETGPPPLLGQGVVVMRKRDGEFTRADLERPEPGEPRELAAAQENVATLRAEVEELAAENRMFAASRSWRLGRPLRAVARVARRTLGRSAGEP